MSSSWYEDEHPCMIEAHAHFVLDGSAFDPDEVTRRLALTPTLVIRAGDDRRTVSGRVLDGAYEFSKWMIETDGRLASTSLERHLNVLLELLEPHAGEIEQLRSELSCDTRFECYFVASTDVISRFQGPGFSTATLARIVKLGADLTFDFATLSRDEDE